MAYDYRAEFERLQKQIPDITRMGGVGTDPMKYADLPETLRVYQHRGYEEPKPLYTQQWQLERTREFAERFKEAGLWTEESPYYRYFTNLKLGQEPDAPPELRLRPREKYDDWVKRLVAAGYRPFSGPAGPGGPEATILLMRQAAGEYSYGRPTPTPTPSPQPTIPTPTMAQPTPIASTPQPTPTPSVSFTPAAQQPTYQPAPATTYQSTYYQANGYKPYGGYQQDTFGDKPFSYAYQRPRLQQSYTGI